MNKHFRLFAACAALACAGIAPMAQASAVLNFEGDAIAGLYLPGDSFSTNGFTLTARGDFGTVGGVADLGLAAPSGNASQFYFNSNDGFLSLTRDDGGTFSLDGFSAAFVPLIPSPSPAPTIVMVAYGFRDDGSDGGVYWPFGGSNTTNFPFQTYSNPLDFAGFNNLVELLFFACVLDASVCATPTRNNAQFAIDDIRVTATVPEPSTLALLSLCMVGLALSRRRSAS